MLSIVVAVAENGVIGRDNQLPWRLPADLKRFKAVTMGKPIVLGRRTYESIGRPLPGRTNIVITRQRDLSIAGCVVVDSIDAALRHAQSAAEIAVIGGADIFRETLPRVQRIYLTRVHARVPGDIYFPALDPSEWREADAEFHPADELHAHAFSFVTLERESLS